MVGWSRRAGSASGAIRLQQRHRRRCRLALVTRSDSVGAVDPEGLGGIVSHTKKASETFSTTRRTRAGRGRSPQPSSNLDGDERLDHLASLLRGRTRAHLQLGSLSMPPAEVPSPTEARSRRPTAASPSNAVRTPASGRRRACRVHATARALAPPIYLPATRRRWAADGSVRRGARRSLDTAATRRTASSSRWRRARCDERDYSSTSAVRASAKDATLRRAHRIRTLSR